MLSKAYLDVVPSTDVTSCKLHVCPLPFSFSLLGHSYHLRSTDLRCVFTSHQPHYSHRRCKPVLPLETRRRWSIDAPTRSGHRSAASIHLIPFSRAIFLELSTDEILATPIHIRLSSSPRSGCLAPYPFKICII